MQNRRLFAVSTSDAYLFLMIALLLGLPLLSAYYSVNPGFFVDMVIPYLSLTAIVTLYLIRRSGSYFQDPSRVGKTLMDLAGGRNGSFISKFNSKIPIYGVMALATVTMGFYGFLRYLVVSSFPEQPPQGLLNLIGWIYMALLIVTAIVGVGRALYGGFPMLGEVLRNRKYAILAAVISLCFAFVYSLVVNGLLIVGLNAPGTVAPISGTYPYVYPPMILGTLDPVANLIYLPTMVVQLSYEVNFIIIPFEVVFAAILSLLVGSNVALAHYLISSNGLRCSTKGTALSTSGSIIGLTATCPTCLVPAFVSAILGAAGTTSLVSVQTLYYNVYGVVLPPIISVVTLLISLVYLSKEIRKSKGEISSPEK